MEILTVKFNPDEKDLLHDFIVANALMESRCREENGHEFEITKDNFPQLMEMTLDVTVCLFENCSNVLDPEPPEVIKRKVTSFTYKLVYNGDEVQTNLDPNFEYRVIKSLEI